MDNLSRREFLASMGTILAGGLSGMSLAEAMEQPVEKLAEHMPMTVLGRTGWKTPIIGLGTMFYAKTYEGGRKSTISEAQSDRLLNTALDLGINTWETGRAYNDAEAMIGRVLSKRREEVFITSKSLKLKAGKEGVLRDLEISLQTLNTDHLDCFQLHNCSSITELNLALAENGSVEGLKQAQKEGKTRFIGITTHSCQAFMTALRSGIFDIHVIPHNAMSLEFERGLALAHKLGAAVFNMKPFGCGDTGIGLLNYDPGDPYQIPEVLTDEECLRFVLSNPGVTIAIPGSGTLEYLKRNVALAATFKPLSPSEREDITARARRLAGGTCGICQKPCEQACPKQVPISFLLSNNQLDRRFLYDTRRMSDIYAVLPHDYLDCENCGECEKACPQKFALRTGMAEAHERLSDLRARMMNH
ncbi:MAG TPA: aldo/keto reductase [archaeon]|nr:aldo/keto reductase [archaeon]